MLLAVLWLQLPGLAGAARLSGWLVALGAALAELNAAKLQEAPVEGPAEEYCMSQGSQSKRSKLHHPLPAPPTN